jgi:hypothetical protein
MHNNNTPQDLLSLMPKPVCECCAAKPMGAAGGGSRHNMATKETEGVFVPGRWVQVVALVR